MAWIVWDNTDCKIFRTAKSAWAYLTPILKDNPLVADSFRGFGKTVTNINNHVGVLRNYDTVKPWSDAPPYLQPEEGES